MDGNILFVLIVTRRVFVVLPFLWLCALFKQSPVEFFKTLYHLDVMILKINKIFLYRKNNLLTGDHSTNHVFSISLKFLLDVIILQLNSCGHKNKNDHIRRIMHYYMAISVLSSIYPWPIVSIHGRGKYERYETCDLNYSL